MIVLVTVLDEWRWPARAGHVLAVDVEHCHGQQEQPGRALRSAFRYGPAYVTVLGRAE